MATEHQPTGGQFLRTGVQAGAIALVIRMIFALTLEQMSFGSALAIACCTSRAPRSPRWSSCW